MKRKLLENKALLIFFIILLIVGGVKIYQITNSTYKVSQDQENDIAKVSPTPVIETLVKTEPAAGRLGILKKDVQIDGCSGIREMVVYTDADGEDPGSMVIVSRKSEFANSKAAEYIQKSWIAIQDYLDGKEYFPEDDASELEGGFRYYCGGYSSAYIRDIPISYPNVDKARAFMSMTGHDPWGRIMIAVLAQKDDDLILLRVHLTDHSLYHPYYKNCPHEDANCYRKKIFNDPFIKELATRYAVGLVGTFALRE